MAENDAADVTVKVEGIPDDLAAMAALKSGWRSTEFWIALGLKLLGAWLIAKGKDELGMVLVLAGGGGYMLQRGQLKKAEIVRRVAGLMIVGMLVLGMTGCCTGHVSAAAVAPSLMSVSTRHDNYVQSDPTLDDLHRSVYLRDTTILRAILAEAGAVEEGAWGDGSDDDGGRGGK
jgi:hypothetical protein